MSFTGHSYGTAQSTTAQSSLIIANAARCVGFPLLCHDACTLDEIMRRFKEIPIGNKFANGVAMRTKMLGEVSRVYDNPFTCAVTTTVPIGMDIVEATARSGGEGSTSYEFNIMRTVDFIGRNYLLITLPKIDCSDIKEIGDVDPSSPKHSFLGAWHRDLVPRIISSLSFYSRSNGHTIFEYSGYDLYLFNLLFGNARKEINDVMAGEDKFEIAYDPYFVDGAALGLASFKGINPFEGITVSNDGTKVSVNSVVNSLQIDNCMDNEEFREFYRRGVWFETPYNKNATSRHSIHSRRMVHNAKDLWVPLDILPFGYNIASSINVQALHGDCGFIHVDLYSNWLDRAFYVTRLSDIPALYSLPNHTHYKPNDIVKKDDVIGDDNDWRNGWVNQLSLGNYGPNFQKAKERAAQGLPKEERPSLNAANVIIGAELSNTEYRGPAAAVAVPNTATGQYGAYADGEGAVTGGDLGKYMIRDITSKTYRKGDTNEIELTISPLSKISPAFYNQVKNDISVRLIQVGYKTLPSVRELLTKLPNINICTEWKDLMFKPSSRAQFDIVSDLYMEAAVLMFVPKDSNGIESMRMYPIHYIDHELDVINGVHICNENGQGSANYSWSMLNMTVPSILELQNPLPENIGIIPFAPKLTSCALPNGFYDVNVCGQLRLTLLPWDRDSSIANRSNPVNMKGQDGWFIVSLIGINGICTANLCFSRLA